MKAKDLINTIKFFWYGIKYKYITVPKHKKELMKNLDYVHWDIIDSSIEILFKQFEMFWLKYGKKRFEDKEYLKEIKKQDRNGEGGWYNAVLQQKKIFDYIHARRIANRKIVDAAWDDVNKYIKYTFVPLNKEYSTMNTEYLEGHYDIIWEWDENDNIILSQVDSGTTNKLWVSYIEQDLSKKDTEYAKKILDIRDFLWD